MTQSMSCEACKRFFSQLRCSAKEYGECDCPKCQGYCECLDRNAHIAELLEKVYAMCVPDEHGCMLWKGAVQRKCQTPIMRSVDRKGSSLRRWMLQERIGRKLKHNHVATYTCGNMKCVRIEHLTEMSRKKLQERNQSLMNAATRLSKSHKLSVNARKRAKLSEELAKQIAEADGSQREIARRFGVSQSTVGSVRRGKTWRDSSNPFARLAA